MPSPFPASAPPRVAPLLAVTWSRCADPEIVALTARIDALTAAYQPLPSGEERFALHAQAASLVSQRRQRFERLRARGVVVEA